MGIRPEFIRLVFDEPSDGLRARVTGVEDFGSYKIVTVAMGHSSLQVRLNEEDELRGELGWLVFPPERTLLYRDSRVV